MSPRRALAVVRSECGGATAEFAVVLPAVLVVLALGLGGVRAGALRLLAQDAAADAARSLDRGDPSSATAAVVAREAPGATLRARPRGDLVCATVTVAAPLGLAVSAESCALSGGR